MPLVEQVVEHVRGGGFVVALLDLTEADIIDDEQLGRGPAPQPFVVSVVRDACVEIVDQIDAAGVTDRELLLASAERERLQDVALPGAVLAREDQVLLASYEVEAREFHDERA